MNSESSPIEDAASSSAVYAELCDKNAYTPKTLFHQVTSNLVYSVIRSLRHSNAENIAADLAFVMRWHKWHGILAAEDSGEVSRTQDSFRRLKKFFARLKVELPSQFYVVTIREFECIPRDADRINSLVKQIPDDVLEEKEAVEQDLPAFKVRGFWGSENETNRGRKMHFWCLRSLEDER